MDDMKQVKRAFAALLCVATVLSLCMVYAGAGNVCQEIKGTGAPSSSVTFTVTTNSKWGKNDLKITQTKGEAYNTMCDNTYSAYGLYKVTYTNSDGKEKTKYFTGDKVKLDLKPSQTYTVTVRAYDKTSVYNFRSYNNHYGAKGGFDSWVSESDTPVWTVSAQKNITLCQ